MDLTGLIPEFKVKVELVLGQLHVMGHEMRPFYTLRGPFEQARLWRQGVTSTQIAAKCAYLRAHGAHRTALCIESVGPQHGRWATNAPPGYSWHQHGEAIDCFLANPDGSANWDASALGYIAYASLAKDAGLSAGRDFKSMDAVHIQYRHHEPHHAYSPAQLDTMLAARYPEFAALK